MHEMIEAFLEAQPWLGQMRSEGRTIEMKSKTPPSNKVLGEPDAHVMMRRAKMVLRILLIMALIATIALLVFYRPAAYLAAISIPVLGLIFGIVSVLEMQSRASRLRRPGQKSISQDEIDLDVENAGIYTALEIAFVLVVGTTVVAATIVDWAMIGIVAAVLLLLAIFITLPYIPLLVMDAAHEEREKVTPQIASEEQSSEA